MPAHNEEKILSQKICFLEKAFQKLSDHQCHVIIVENGSDDNTFKIAKTLENKSKLFSVSVIQSNKGIGHAYDEGLKTFLSIGSPKDMTVLSAADLPFGVTDLQNVLKYSEIEKQIFIGSKYHPNSVLELTLFRRALSYGFFILRKFFLRLPVLDTQGTFFIPHSYAEHLHPRICSRDFFFSTELSFHAYRSGMSLVEVPVILNKNERPSKVRLLHDSIKMIVQIFKLRFGLLL